MNQWFGAVFLFLGLAVWAASEATHGDYHASLLSVHYVSCSEEERKAPGRVDFFFPQQGQVLNSVSDLALSRSLLVRMRTHNFKPGVNGRIMVIIMGVDIADIQGNRGVGDAAHTFKVVSSVTESNVELFGMTEGDYRLNAVLVDNAGHARDCWVKDTVTFSIEVPDPRNRSEALLNGLNSFTQKGGRKTKQDREPWMVQPRSHSDFGYVTAVWGDAYIDNVLAWSASLVAAGSTFKRYCMIVPELLWEGYLEYLERCCCELLRVEPIHAPWEATRGKWSRYELVLTKLRVFQLGRFGLKKLVLMDADTLVLQNIDELFWNPAPASTLVPGSILGDLGPKLSAGVMVIEPSEAEFQAVMARLSKWVAAAANTSDTMLFLEQDLMDMHWQSEDGRLKYHVLPFVYNTCPDMLDTMPFLAPENTNSPPTSFPLDHGVKVLHLWNWFNPVLATTHSARQAMQLHARLKHKQLWRWYEIWWDMHQLAMARAIPELVHAAWKETCVAQNLARFGDFHASKIVPVLQGGRGRCMHIYGGLAW